MGKTRQTGNLVSKSNIFVNTSSDKTGIGTTTPTSKLDVVGDVQISGILTATSFRGDGSLLTGINASGAISISTNTTNSNQLIPYTVSTGSTTGLGATNLFVFNPSTSRLGIGTTNPTSTLQVQGNSLFTGNATASSSSVYLSGAPLGTAGSNGLLGVGTINFTDTNIIASFTHNVNNYAQIILQNTNSGTTASADFIVNNDRTAGTSYYGDFGINATTFSGGGPFGDPDGTYVYSSNGTLTLGSITLHPFKVATNNSERLRVTEIGNVGIGITNPTTTLTVGGATSTTHLYVTGVSTSGTIQIGSGIITATSGVVTYFGDGSRLSGILTSGAGGSSSLSISANITNSNQFIPYTVSTGSTTGLGVTNLFVFNPSTTSLGIGITVPTAKLSVASTSTGASLLVVNDNLSDGAVFRVNDNNANVLMDVDAAGTILFPTSGNIGIGTTLTTPSSKLHVIGDITANNFLGNVIGTAATVSTVRILTGIITATSGVVTYYGDGSRLTGILTTGSAGGSTGQVQFNLSGSPTGANFFNYDNTQFRVGIGTSVPTARLSVASTTTGSSLLVVNDNLSDGSVFRVNDNNANILMDVDANGTILFPTSGNVGIGTTLATPSSKLHVLGDTLVSGVSTSSGFFGNLSGIALTVTTGIITNIVSTAATISNFRISSGIITASTGVVTYFGDGSKLSGVIALTNVGAGASGQMQFNDGGPLGGASYFNYDKTTARVGIGTSLPTARLSVASTSTGASLLVVNDNLSDGAVFRVNDNNANVLMDVDAAGTIIFTNSGNVGIGTTLITPSSKLHVLGDTLISGVSTSSGFFGNLTGTGITATSGIITNITSVNQNFSGITTTQRLNVGTGGTIIATTTGGLVGIGTSVPNSRFNVSAPTSGTSLMVVNDNLSDGAVFRVNDNNANVLMDVDANGTILFLNSGNVGIGTTLATPTSKLHVIGDALITGIITTTQRLNVGTGGTIIATTTGGVGIGTTTTYGDTNSSFTALSIGGNKYGLLEIKRSDGVAGAWIDSYGTSGNNDLRITTAGTNGSITFWTGGAFTEKVRITSGGLVGIGTTNPQSTLHVQGQFQSTQANNTATGGGQIYLNGATGNRIDFANAGVAAPTFTTRSVGTKIALYPLVGASSVDYGFGVESSALWSSIESSIASFKWYAGTTNIATLFGTGELVIGTTTKTGTASQPLQVTGGAYISGSVGIGTTNPSQKLEVVGGEIKAGRVDASQEGGQFSLARSTDNATAWYIDVYGNTSTPELRFVDVSNSAVRAGIDSTGNFQFNSGYGSAATVYGCRAWVNFDGTTASPSTRRGSGNVSSVTKNGTGDYTVNFTSALADANYAFTVDGYQTAVANTCNSQATGQTVTTTALRLQTTNSSFSLVDSLGVSVCIFR